MIEDAENALNPSPMLNAMLGSGYPQCKQVTLSVGDVNGVIADPTTGTPWIDSPQTATQGSGGMMYQTRWIQDTDANGYPINLTKDQWSAVPKTYNPDGTPISTESFTDRLTSPPGLAVVGLLVLIAFGVLSRQRR